MIGKQTLAFLAATALAGGSIAASAGAQSTGATNADAAFSSRDKFSEPDGASLYANVCAGCHMADGKGAVGAGMYPSLEKSDKLEASGYPVYVLVNGLNGMPALGGMMSDKQVADVVNYVRTHFGNTYKDAVTPQDVAALR